MTEKKKRPPITAEVTIDRDAGESFATGQDSAEVAKHLDDTVKVAKNWEALTRQAHAMLNRATAFMLHAGRPAPHDDIRLVDRTGTTQGAWTIVAMFSMVFTKEQEWVREPMASSRTPEFLENTRWTTWKAALCFWQEKGKLMDGSEPPDVIPKELETEPWDTEPENSSDDS